MPWTQYWFRWCPPDVQDHTTKVKWVIVWRRYLGTKPFDGERKCLDERLHSDAHNEWHFSHTHALFSSNGSAAPIYLQYFIHSIYAMHSLNGIGGQYMEQRCVAFVWYARCTFCVKWESHWNLLLVFLYSVNINEKYIGTTLLTKLIISVGT